MIYFQGTLIGLGGDHHGSIYTPPDVTNSTILNISAEEAKAIADVCRSWALETLQASGLYMGGEKYTFLRADEGGQLLAKKKGKGSLTIQVIFLPFRTPFKLS